MKPLEWRVVQIDKNDDENLYWIPGEFVSKAVYDTLLKDWERLNIKCGDYSLENEALRKNECGCLEELDAAEERVAGLSEALRWYQREYSGDTETSVNKRFKEALEKYGNK